MSAATRERKDGAASEPVVGPAKIALADWVDRVADSVPLDVTGAPLTVKMFGRLRPTLVTVPAPKASILSSTQAVVATRVESSLRSGVVAVAAPRPVVPLNVTVPENV